MASDRVVVPLDLRVVSVTELQDLRQRLIESKRDIEMQFGSQRKRRPDVQWRERAVLALGHIEKDLVHVKRELLKRHSNAKRPSLMPLLAEFFQLFSEHPQVPPTIKQSAAKLYHTIQDHYAE